MLNFKNYKKIHFIGIGGSGMFPLSKVLHEKGFIVTGSDNYPSDTLQKVKNAGIKVYNTHSEENIKDCDLVVFSAAIKNSNPEIKEAKRNNIPLVPRSELLGAVMGEYKNSVGVAGTHGKTTTTSMITSILIDAKKDPTALIGGTLPKIKANSCAGKSDIMVAEACEYMDSFLNMSPAISVITNVDEDHLDYFKTMENIKKSFEKYACRTTGKIILNGDDLNSVECVKNAHAEKIYFGLNEKNDFFAKNLVFDSHQYGSFDVFFNKNKIAHISLNVPGYHNVYNALAAFATAYNMGCPAKTIEKSLKEFCGVHRRFEVLSKSRGITVADDFAHHPTELKTTLTAASKMGYKTVWAIFQPHTYSRTALFLDDFAKVLSIADRVIVSDILPVRETNTYGVYATDLTKKIKNSKHIPTFPKIADFVIKNAQEGDLILTLGGGNIYECANLISGKLNTD